MFRVAMKLPYGPHPSTVKFTQQGYSSEVKYLIKITIRCVDRADVIHSNEFAFTTSAYHNYDGALLPMTGGIDRVVSYQCFCMQTGSAQLFLSTDKSVYYPGEKITCSFWCDETEGGFSGKAVLSFERVHRFTDIDFPVYGNQSFIYDNTDQQFSVVVNQERNQVDAHIPSDWIPSYEHSESPCAWYYRVALTLEPTAKGQRVSFPIVINGLPPTDCASFPSKWLPRRCRDARDAYNKAFGGNSSSPSSDAAGKTLSGRLSSVSTDTTGTTTDASLASQSAHDMEVPDAVDSGTGHSVISAAASKADEAGAYQPLESEVMDR